MAKLTIPTTGTPLDPLQNTNAKLNELGIVPIHTDAEKFSTAIQQDRLNSFSDVNMEQLATNSLYSNDAEAQSILEERRAQNQSAGEQLFKGLGHVLSTAGTEVLKLPGYVGGGVMALVEKGMGQNNVMQDMVNNQWVNALESLDKTIKDQIPVYLQKDVEEGNIGRKLMSSAWWATAGADGIGFLISMYAPGQLLRALNVGKYIGEAAQAVGREGKLAKLFTSANILKQTEAGALFIQKGINNANSFAAVSANTFLESASEAANSFDNAKQNYLTAHPGATEEEASANASEVAANVFKANMVLLPISNTLDELFLFKGFDNAAKKVAEKSIVGKLLTDGVFDISKIKKLGIKEALKEGVPHLAMNLAKEGLFEEGLQSEVQQHFEDKGAGKTKLGFMEDVVYNYFDDLASDPQMQESVALGGILGGIAGAFGTAGEIKQKNRIMFGQDAKTPSFLGKVFGQKERQAVKGLAETMNTNFINSFRTIHDIAQKKEDGSIDTDERGKIKIDQVKLKAAMEQKDAAVTLNQLHNLAILEGNETEAGMYGDLLTMNYFLPFLQQEGGYEALKEHVNTQLTEAMVAKSEAAGQKVSNEDKAKLKENLQKKAEELHAIYEEVSQTTNPEIYVKTDDRNKYSAWKQHLLDSKIQALVANKSATKSLGILPTLIQVSNPLLDEGFKNQTLTPEQLNEFDPVSAVRYKLYGERKATLEGIIKQTKDKYVELNTKEGLRKSYEEYKKEVAEVEKKTEEVIAETQAEEKKKAEVAVSHDDFVNDLAREHNIITQPDTKGFYVKEKNVLLEDDKGNRYSMQSQYSKVKDSEGKESSRVDQVLYDKNGKSQVITDSNGNLNPAFLNRRLRIIGKDQLALEGRAINLKKRKDAQLALIDEIVSHRTNEINNSKQELEQIEKDLEAFTNKVEELKQQADKFYKEKLEGRVKPRKQVKLNYEEMKATLASVEQTIKNLINRKTYLESRLPKLELLVNEYTEFRQVVADKEATSLSQEKQIAEEKLLEAIGNLSKDTVLEKDIVAVQELIDKSKTLINEMSVQLDKLVALRNTLRRIIASHGAFYQLLSLNEKQKKEAIDRFNDEFKNVPFPYSIERIIDLVTKEPHAVLAGETLAKNNIITNAEEIANYLGITPEDVLNKVQDIFSNFALDEQELIKQYGLSPQEAYELRDKLWATNKEINQLREAIGSEQSVATVQELNKRYLVLEELNQNKVIDRFTQIKSDQERKSLDKTQVQSKTADAEPIAETDMRSVFMAHALPITPYSTTGKNVLYNRDGSEKGKDQLDEQGFPVLNDNVFQRTWFTTIDKLANNIQDYTLLPVHAKYDSSDEFQKAIEANFPNEDQRGTRDVFVFLVDSSGKHVMVDNNGNRIGSGGNLVFTSVRKADEVFPPGEQPRVVPDSILNNYLKSLGIPEKKDWKKVKDKLVGEVITSKKGRELFKDDLDKPIQVVMDKAIELAREQYEEFINELIKSKDKVMPIEGVSKGRPLYQVVNGKKVRSKPLSVFTDVKLEEKKYGVDQLNGAKVGTIINNAIKVRGNFIDLTPGSVYMQFPNDDFVMLQSRNINDTEAKTVMVLLSMAANVNNLNTLGIPFPKKKDGTPYFYMFNNKRLEGTIPIFYRKSVDGVENFSLLHSLINYGSKPDIHKNGEIYIQSGKVMYQDFNGKRGEVTLAELAESVQNGKLEKHNDNVAALHEFLLQKRFNVNRVLLGNNPRFMYPTLAKENGKYTVKLDYSKTYYEFMFDNVLTTSAIRKEGYPQFLQRNVIYKPELTSRTAIPTTNTAVEPKAPTQPKPAVIEGIRESGDGKREWLTGRIAALQNVVANEEEIRNGLNSSNAEENKKATDTINQMLQAAAKRDGFSVNDEDLANVKQQLISPTPAVETPAPVKGELVAKERPSDDLFSEQPVPKTNSLAKRLAARKGTVDLKPKNKTADESVADKRVDPNILLNQLIQNKEIKKDCL